jgi:hypothetical protein
VLVREPGALERAFSVSPDYLADTAAQDAEVNFAARGLQLTRGSRALKLWMSLRTFGISAFRDAIDRTLDLALLAEQTVRADDRLELMMDATLGIICFRRRFPDVETEAEAAFRNAALVASVAESGIGMVSSTRLRGRYAIRLCVLNHSTTADDVLRVIDHVASASVGDQQPRMQLDAERFLAHPPQRPRLEVDHLRRHPLMVTLSEPGRRLVARVGKELRLPAGEVVVRRWASDRDFYLVLDGELRGRRGRRRGATAGRRGLLRRARRQGLGVRLRLPAARHRHRPLDGPPVAAAAGVVRAAGCFRGRLQGGRGRRGSAAAAAELTFEGQRRIAAASLAVLRPQAVASPLRRVRVARSRSPSALADPVPARTRRARGGGLS